MKLSKKDKIMLIVLAVIMIVALTVVYGIMPAKEKSTALDSQISAKKAEVQAMNDRLAGLDIGEMDAKFDALYEKYFAENKPSTLSPLLGKKELEKMMYAILNDLNIKGYATAGWHIDEERIQIRYDDVIIESGYYVASMPINFKVKTRAEFREILNYFAEDKNFAVKSYNVTETPEVDEVETEGGGGATPDTGTDGGATPDPGTPDTGTDGGATLDPGTPDPGTGGGGTIPPEQVIGYSTSGGTTPLAGEDAQPEEEQFDIQGTLLLEYYMGDKYVSDKLPKPLADVTNLALDGASNKIIFDKVENAVDYKVYLVSRLEGADTSYVEVVGTTAVVDEATGKVRIELIKGLPKLQTGVEQEIVVRAIGDYKQGYFKTVLNESSPIVKVIVS